MHSLLDLFPNLYKSIHRKINNLVNVESNDKLCFMYGIQYLFTLHIKPEFVEPDVLGNRKINNSLLVTFLQRLDDQLSIHKPREYLESWCRLIVDIPMDSFPTFDKQLFTQLTNQCMKNRIGLEHAMKINKPWESHNIFHKSNMLLELEKNIEMKRKRAEKRARELADELERIRLEKVEAEAAEKELLVRLEKEEEKVRLAASERDRLAAVQARGNVGYVQKGVFGLVKGGKSLVNSVGSWFSSNKKGIKKRNKKSKHIKLTKKSQ